MAYVEAQAPLKKEPCESGVGTKALQDQNMGSVSPHELGSPTDNRPTRRRRARTMFDDQAIFRMEAVFSADQYPDIALREQLAEQLGVSEARIQTWFQNKRSRSKRISRNLSGEDKKVAVDSRKTPPDNVRENNICSKKPIARVQPKPGKQIKCHTAEATSKIGIKRSREPDHDDQKHHMRKVPAFRPFYREVSPKKTEQVNQSEGLVCRQKESNSNSPPMSQPPQNVSYATMFNAADGKYYLQPFPNFPPFYPPYHSGMNPFLTSPPAGSLAPSTNPMKPFLAAMMGSQSVVNPLCHFTGIPHMAGMHSMVPTCYPNQLATQKSLSAKNKLSSVAWLASSHKKELNFDDASSTGEDHHSDGSTASPLSLQKDEEEIDICG